MSGDDPFERARRPDIAGYPRYDVDIVSPELPCGSAWLANCLLELGVAVWKPWNVGRAADWEKIASGRYRYIDGTLPLRRSLPALREGREFRFAPTPVPRIQHYWPGFLPQTKKVILFVRDPRDALHSVWRRALALGQIEPDVDFIAFVQSRYHHYPFRWIDYPLLFLRIWRAWLDGCEAHIVRYEDYRADAETTLRRALAFLGVARPAVEIDAALQASSFETMHRLERAIDAAPRVNRAGTAHEHRRVFTPGMRAVFDRRYDDLFAWLDYDANPAAAVARIDRVVAAADVLHAMRSERAEPRAQAWLRNAVAAGAADIAPVD